jgi:hypothetical protein
LLSCTPQSSWSDDVLSHYDVDFRLMFNERFQILNNFYSSESNSFSRDKNYLITYVNPYLSAQLGPHLRGVLELETEVTLDLDSRDFEEETEVRNAYIQYMLPAWNWITFSIGRQALRTIDGLLYDYEAPAFKAYLDMERRFDVPIRIQTFFAETRGQSPYFHSELKYNFPFLESVTLSYDWYSDKNNGIAKIFYDVYAQQIVGSKGHLQWFSLSLEKFLYSFLFKNTFIYERGTLNLQQEGQGEKHTRAEAYLVNLTCDYRFSKKLLGSFFLYLSSGDKHPEQGTFTSFISIDPYINKTTIFFNGGIDRQFSVHNVGLNGIPLNGVIAPGVTVYYHPAREITLKNVFAYFFTQKGNGGRGNTYGWETDFMGLYNLNEHWQLVMEANFFNPGKYYNELTGYNAPLVTEIIGGISYYF